MNNKPFDPRFTPLRKRTSTEKVGSFDLTMERRFGEVVIWVMVVLFFLSAFCIHSYFNCTLITVIQASKLFVGAGLAGFLLTYLLRRPLRLSIFDGLLFNLFGTAPIALALFLVINAQTDNCSEQVYLVMDRKTEGTGYTCVLEDDALDDYWHIRNLDKHETNARGTHLHLTVCKGVLGYEVMKSRLLE